MCICFITCVLFYTWKIKYTALLLWSRFSHFLNLDIGCFWEKYTEILNLKHRIEMFFIGPSFTETAYSSLVYNEVFLDFNVFLINVFLNFENFRAIFQSLLLFTIWLGYSLLPWSFSQIYCVSSQYRIVNKHLDHYFHKKWNQWSKQYFFMVKVLVE